MKETKVYEEYVFENCPLICRVISMGKDYTVTVCGGTLPHIGSAVMAQARPSLTGQGISATSSVLNCVGHKDEAVARMFAEKIAVYGNCTVVCVCGIHLDNISEEQLARVQECCERLIKCALVDMKNMK
nr:hypothetical protein [uncultured Acetatifactor sp.]